MACRMLALANALDGMSRTEAATRAGLDRQALASSGDPLPCRGRGRAARPAAERAARLSRSGAARDAESAGSCWADPETDGVSAGGRRTSGGWSRPGFIGTSTTAGFQWRYGAASGSGGRVAGGGGASATRRARPRCRAGGPDEVPEQAAQLRDGERQELGHEVRRGLLPRPRPCAARRDRRGPAWPR